MDSTQPISMDVPIKIAQGIYWVGFYDETSKLQCNPYLIVEKDRAVLIDGGSRSDFPSVMMKILQTGLKPEQIVALIYHHPDPDLCGSMLSLIELCKNPELRVLSHSKNRLFISFYVGRDKRRLFQSIDEGGYRFSLCGRVLTFIETPYAHTEGSFVTYDEKTRTLFSSDLFGSLTQEFDLFLQLREACYACEAHSECPAGGSCPVKEILRFHESLIPTKKALTYALDGLSGIDVETIAPQHGRVIMGKRQIKLIIERLKRLKGVGIDLLTPKREVRKGSFKRARRLNPGS